MTPDDTALLDNPAWHALTGPQRHLALRPDSRRRAHRYRADVSPFAAIRDPHDIDGWNELARLCEPSGHGALEAPRPVPAPAGWTISRVFELAQMIAPDQGCAPPDPPETVVALNHSDVPEMLELAQLTHPGPFLPATVDFGGYIGVRCAGRLAAMAGRRLHLPGWIEISAVCTHPDHRGRGLARVLTSAVEADIRRSGQRAFLHVLHENHTAATLYRALGFTVRADMTITVVHPAG